MGQPAARKLAEALPRFDGAHLGPKGAALCSAQVLEGMLKLRPELAGARPPLP